jgi:hypothetical protein
MADLHSANLDAPVGAAPATPQASPPESSHAAPGEGEAVSYTREELLRQAALQPDTTFVLPQVVKPAEITNLKVVEVIPHTPPKDKPLPKRVVPIDLKAKEPDPGEKQNFVIHIEKVGKPHPVPPAPPPKPISTPLPDRKEKRLQEGIMEMTIEEKESGGHYHVSPKAHSLPPPPPPPKAGRPSSSHTLATVLGGLLAVALLGAGASVLALNGLRIPYVYPLLTGLPVKGAEVVSQAASAVKTAAAYSYQWEATLQEQGKQPIADVQAYKESSDPIRSVKVSASSGANLTDEYSASDIALKVDGIPSARASVRQPVSWLSRKATRSVYSVAALDDTGKATQLLLQVPNSDLREWLPSVAILQPRLDTLLAGVGGELDYAKSLNDKPGAKYGFALPPSAMVPFLPTGAVWSGGSLEMIVPWKSGGTPRWVKVSGTFRYGAAMYALTYQWLLLEYGNVSYPLSSETTKDIGNTAVYSTGDTLWNMLGLTATRIPHNLITSTAAAPPTPTATASASASPSASPTPTATPTSTPSPTPTATPWQALVPSGDSISSPIGVLPEQPIVPALTDAGRQRDAQRKKDLATLAAALRQYKVVHGSYPLSASATQLQANATIFGQLVPTFVSKMPIDPLKQLFWYEYRSDGAAFTVRAIVEDPTDPASIQGSVYHYIELSGN